MFADLHVHSIYSDGRYAPEEICQRAISRGISLLSITDHDTLAGEEEKRASAKKYGVKYVTGWEISAYLHGEKMHVLGYGCALNEGYFRFMRERTEAAYLRMEDSVKKLQALGVPVSKEQVLLERLMENSPVHTMHVARAVAKALSISDGEAYLRYLAVGKEGHSDLGRPTPKQAIDCIHACGGIAILAHPGRIPLPVEEREKIIRSLAKEGLDGIEATYTTHTKEETAYFLRLTETLGLFSTGGSDTHYEEESHQIGFPRFTPSKPLLDRLGI